MRISQLRLSNFRNISVFAMAIPEAENGQIIGVFGENGAGKTSVLEALSFLSPGKGLHRSKPDEVGHYGAKEWGLYAKTGHETEIWRTFSGQNRKPVDKSGHVASQGRGGSSQGWKLRIDGDENAKQSSLTSIGNIMW